MSENKTERNLHEGKFGLKAASRKGKQRCFPPDVT